MNYHKAEAISDELLNLIDLTEQQSVILLWMVGAFPTDSVMKYFNVDGLEDLHDFWYQVTRELGGK